MAVLENIEWLSIWWDGANRSGRRILLVGDSVTQAYRPKVKELVGDNFLVDSHASSRALDNPRYLEEIIYMLQQYEYEIIQFNNGLHGFHLDAGDYASHYELLLTGMMERQPAAKFHVALSTPVTSASDAGCLAPGNSIVVERNEKVRALAEKFGIPCFDLYNLALENPHWKVPGDGYHFTGEGNEAFAKYTVAQMKIGK